MRAGSEGSGLTAVGAAAFAGSARASCGATGAWGVAAAGNFGGSAAAAVGVASEPEVAVRMHAVSAKGSKLVQPRRPGIEEHASYHETCNFSRWAARGMQRCACAR